MHICNFSGAAADLPKGKRTETDVLNALSKHPRVSAWDMSETSWLRGCIAELKRRELIVSKDECYPWCRYELTDAGWEEMALQSSVRVE